MIFDRIIDRLAGVPKVYFRKTSEVSCDPTMAHSQAPYSDACFDLYSRESLVVRAHSSLSVETGIAMQLPKETKRWKWEAQIRPRSSMRKAGIVASLGTIDAGYRGEIGCILHNLTSYDYQVHVGDRVCQLAIVRLPKVNLICVDVLDASERGFGRYGSSGK